jgi:uncharacterized membrane protein YcaP (DUF421 family)
MGNHRYTFSKQLKPLYGRVAAYKAEAVAIGMEDTHTPLVNAIPITVALGMLRGILTWLNLRFRWLERWTPGTPALLIVNGRINDAELPKERVSHADLMTKLRQNDTTLSDLKEARLEPTGKISILTRSSSQPSSPPKKPPSS